MELNLEDKRKIAARVFYTDNKDGDGAFESYEQALTEMNNPSEEFINFLVESYLKPEEGCRLMMNDVGNVVSIRISDSFCEPRTEMTEEEGQELQTAFTEIANEHPEIESGFVLMQKIGWKLI